jgi:hypothetical protein
MDFNLDYNTEFKKTIFTIGDQVVNGFKDILGYRYMDNSQLAKLIGKGEYSARNFWKSKTFKVSVQGSFNDRHFPVKVWVENNYHSLVPTDWAVNFILHWAYKGNKYAQNLNKLLTQQTLDARIDDALGDLNFTKLSKEYDDLIALAWERINHALNYRSLMTICESHGFNIQKINDIVMCHLTGCHTKQFEIDNKQNVNMSLSRAKSLLKIKNKSGYSIDDGVTPSMMDYEMLKSRNRILGKLINKLYQVKRGSWSYDDVQNWMKAKVKI